MARFKAMGEAAIDIIRHDTIDVTLDDEIVADSEDEAYVQARALAIKEAESYGGILGRSEVMHFQVSLILLEATEEERARWEAEANEELMRKIGAPTLFEVNA